MNQKLLDDCFLHDRDSLRHDEALAILRERIAPCAQIARLPVWEAAGRILAEPVTAPRSVPPHSNAAVDGYAFAAADYDAATGSEFTVVGRAAAGHAYSAPVGKGAAVRIFTGAVLPAGADTVVMQEDAGPSRDGAAGVRIPAGLRPGANTRQAGEDVRAGDVVFTAGHSLRPQDLAALASIGLAEVACFERLKVAIVSSGDEVVRAEVGRMAPGQIYDANAPMLGALVRTAGARFNDLGVLPDSLEHICERLAAAAATHHVLLTSGGASRGEEDHMAAALDRLGKRHVWQLAIKPGRSMLLGQIGDCIVVGLPGNPVAAFVGFLVYVWPMLRRLGGAAWPEPHRLRLRADFDFRGRRPGRREFWRGYYVAAPGGGVAIAKFERDGSGLISSLRAADGLIDIPEDAGDVRAGDEIDFIPFSQFGILGGSC